jgi:hypothetical protein
LVPSDRCERHAVNEGVLEHLLCLGRDLPFPVVLEDLLPQPGLDEAPVVGVPGPNLVSGLLGDDERQQPANQIPRVIDGEVQHLPVVPGDLDRCIAVIVIVAEVAEIMLERPEHLREYRAPLEVPVVFLPACLDAVDNVLGGASGPVVLLIGLRGVGVVLFVEDCHVRLKC